MTGLRSLIWLYPKSWRERYADEFTALLDDLQEVQRPATFDLILGAVDAQLHRGRYPMTDIRVPRWPALTVLAGSIAVVALTVVATVLYPQAIDSPGANVFLAVAVALILTYVSLGVLALRRPGDGRGVGAWFGLAAGLSWSIEIWAGGPAKLSYASEQIVGGTFAILAVLITLAAGPFVALTRRTRGAGPRAGLFAGLTSGVLVFCFANVMTLSTLGILASRTDYQHQFLTSGTVNMNTFLVSDMLAGTISHLVINLVLGLIGGGIGALISRVAGRAGNIADPLPL